MGVLGGGNSKPRGRTGTEEVSDQSSKLWGEIRDGKRAIQMALILRRGH
jgi:hypothetical protein